MKTLTDNLHRQLFTIFLCVFALVSICLGILLPKTLIPVYEKTIYQYLKQPLDFINDNTGDIKSTTIAYLYVTKENIVITSSNTSEIIDLSSKQILKLIDSDYGKFKYKSRTYYYYTSYDNYVKKISLTNDDYIREIKTDILDTILPTLFLTFLLISVIIMWWSNRLVRKIRHLKTKIENIDNDNYKDNYVFHTDDELKVVSDAIDNMKVALKQQEEYKNQMYQNISHDFKTPLTVIESYIEAIEDGVETPEDGMKIIKEQLKKLEIKVHSLLYLNKLNYFKDSKISTTEKIDVSKIIKASVKKFKMQRPDIKWEIKIEDKKTIYNGTEDMWEAIIDNLLSNFMRYADKIIKITIKNNKISFYNDGPNFDKEILDDVFSPYKKGINGQFGLGLSIVKKTITLMGYEITLRNERKGVTFMIK